jgi:hypothetical protein
MNATEHWEYTHNEGPYRHFRRVWVEETCTAKTGPLGFAPSPSWPRPLTEAEHAFAVDAYDAGHSIGMTNDGVLLLNHREVTV